jgi:hypothetical protein
MDFWKAVLSLARRKYIGPPVIVLSLAVAGLVYFLAPTHYVSSAFMVLTTPTSGGSLDPNKPISVSNPLLQFNDGLKTTAGILIQSMTTPEVAAQLGAPAGSSTKITIDDGSTNPELLGTSTIGPFVYVKVDARSASVAGDTVRRAQRYLRDDLTSRQKRLRAPQSTFIMITDVVPPSVPEVDRANKWQYAGLALFLGLFVGFGCAYAAGRIKGSRPAAPSAGHREGEMAPDPRPVPTARSAMVVDTTGAMSAAGRTDTGETGWDSDDTAMFVVVVDDGPGPPPHGADLDQADLDQDDLDQDDDPEDDDQGEPVIGRGDQSDRPVTVLRREVTDRRDNLRAPRAG